MRRFLIRLYKDRFKQKGKTKYLVIKTEYDFLDDWYIDGYFECREYSNKQDAKKFLIDDVAKSDRKKWKMYVEIEDKK
jgi:hypothetical protein